MKKKVDIDTSTQNHLHLVRKSAYFAELSADPIQMEYKFHSYRIFREKHFSGRVQVRLLSPPKIIRIDIKCNYFVFSLEVQFDSGWQTQR